MPRFDPLSAVFHDEREAAIGSIVGADGQPQWRFAGVLAVFDGVFQQRLDQRSRNHPAAGLRVGDQRVLKAFFKADFVTAQ